ncbi:MAG: XrtA-associated ATPase [Gammaproteobacteria bacterium]|nr:XrtA-associated ATPase [Gammaproteobacteria bacterium]
MYRKFYGLNDKPFQLSPDSRFYFNSKPHNRAMAYLRYGLEKREGFIVITGGIGTGKTMLVRHLLSELESSDVIAAQLVTTQVEPDDMLRIVCSSFGLGQESAPKSALLDKLEKFFRARDAEGKRVLLVVDEAQNLPPRSIEELRMLSNFQIGGKSLLQSFLLGQIEFDQTIQSPGMEQFRQRIIAALHLKAMDSEETRNYIEFRLGLVDWKDDPQITAGAFEQIFDFTKGIPRRINNLCDRLFLFGCLEERHLLDEGAVRSVISEIEEEGLGNPAPEPSLPARNPSQPPPPAPADFQSDFSASASVPAGDQLMQRLNMLEREIQQLKKNQQHEKKLLRKAILIQMDMDVEDEPG